MTGSDGSGARPPVEGLAVLGLEPVTLDVYRQLLLRPEADLTTLAEACGVGEPQARDALDALAATALLRPSQIHAGTWRPISPEVALRRLVAELEEAHAQQAVRLARVRDDVLAFVTDYREEREARLARTVERLDGRDAVVSMLEELSAASTTEILSMSTSRPAPEAVEQARDSDTATLARGVRSRTIYLEGVVDKAFRQSLFSFVSEGAEVRLAPTLPVRMLIFDRAVAVIATDPDDIGAGAVVLRGGGVLIALVALFEMQWEAARAPFEVPTPENDVEVLSPMDTQVLRLLARGLKDEAVAHHLGVSVRTARRFIADLHERAGAGSRFELGVRAKELGWL